MTSPAWPASLRLLLGDRAGELLQPALAPVDGRLRALRVTGVNLQSDTAATVQYAADVVRPGGRGTRELLTAATGRRIPPGAAVLEGEADGKPVTVGVWRWPLDPSLPALSWATRAAGVTARLAELGLPRTDVGVRVRSYRPGRRAVVEAATASGPLFLKVVRPAEVARLVERHEVLAGPAPVPPVLASTDDGVVVLPGLPGTPMRELLAGDGRGLPDAAALDALLDALPAGAAEVSRRGRPAAGDALARAADHAAVIGLVAEHLRPRLETLTAALAAADPGVHPPVPVHGDFYEGQLLVADGAVVGLLDVDTVGRGFRIDDWATLLGHLALLERILPQPATAARYRAELGAGAARRWPDAQLRPRVAAVLLGLATGPFRVQQAGWPERTEARIALAEQWAGLSAGT